MDLNAKIMDSPGIYQCVRIAFVNLIFVMATFMLYGLLTSSIKPEVPLPMEGLEPADTTQYEISQCEEKFNETFKDNLDVIKHYPRGIADAYLWKIGGNMKEPKSMRSFPVFATALTRNYYPQSQGLFKSLHSFMAHPKYAKHVKIVVYDLGLSFRQRIKLKKNCRCELRKFSYKDFPAHVQDLHTYAFKPVIVQRLLMEFGFVWWIDTSVRFTTINLDNAVNYAKEHSMLYTVSTSPRKEFNVAQQTDTRTFEFLGEDTCKFRPFGETWATTILFYFDDVTRDVVRAWTSCALNKQCIAPDGTDKKLFCLPEDQSDGRCHRFDQAVFSIITRRLFHAQNAYPLDTRLNDIYEIKRGDIVNYFDTCKPVVKCLV